MKQYTRTFVDDSAHQAVSQSIVWKKHVLFSVVFFVAFFLSAWVNAKPLLNENIALFDTQERNSSQTILFSPLSETKAETALPPHYRDSYWQKKVFVNAETSEIMDINQPTLLYLQSEEETQFDFAINGQAQAFLWSGKIWLPYEEDTLSSAQHQILGIVPSEQHSELIIQNRWQIPEEYHYTPSEIGEVLAQHDQSVLPLFIIGDVNEDRKVDSQDFELLYQWLDNYTSQLTCLAAADINRDARVTMEDLEQLQSLTAQEVIYPALSFTSNLPCHYQAVKLAATPQQYGDDHVRIRILDETPATHFAIQLTEGEAEVWQAEDGQGWHVQAMQKSAYVSLLIGTEEEKYSYTFTISDEDKPMWLPKGEKSAFDYKSPANKPIPVAKDCPQRGQGCEVLIVDFLVNNENSNTNASTLRDTLASLKKANGQKQCNITHLTPAFVPHPSTQIVWVKTLGVPHPALLVPTQAAIKLVKTRNKAQWTNIYKKINQYVKKAPQKEMAMEFVFAHGSGSRNAWVPKFDTDFEEKTLAKLGRDWFHNKIHRAINKSVCGHLNFDASCWSGSSPLGLQQLNNSGQVQNHYNPVFINPRKHAAYELDLALSTVGLNSLTEGTMINQDRDILIGLIKKADTNAGNFYQNLKGQLITFGGSVKNKNRNGVYLDSGYKPQLNRTHRLKYR